MVGGRVFFMDLESRLGTVWESGPRRSGWLDKEQGIQIGPYSIHHACVNGNGTALEGESDAAAPSVLLRQGLPEVTLEFVNRTGRSTTWQMSPMLALVGRSPDCRVHLVGQSVSNFHCSLVRTPLGVLHARGMRTVYDAPITPQVRRRSEAPSARGPWQLPLHGRAGARS